MKKFYIIGLLGALCAQNALCWTLKVINATDGTVNIETKWGGSTLFCKPDKVSIPKGEFKNINAGECLLTHLGATVTKGFAVDAATHIGDITIGKEVYPLYTDPALGKSNQAGRGGRRTQYGDAQRAIQEGGEEGMKKAASASLQGKTSGVVATPYTSSGQRAYQTFYVIGPVKDEKSGEEKYMVARIVQ